MRISVGLGVGVVCAIVLAGCDNAFSPVVPSSPVALKADRQPGAPVGTRLPPVVVPKPKAVVAGTFEVDQSGTEPDVAYGFTVKLTESAGVSAAVTSVWIVFDDYWGNSCGWSADKMVHTRLLANETLQLDYLPCDNWGWQAYNVAIEVGLTDDNGYTTWVYLYRPLSPSLR